MTGGSGLLGTYMKKLYPDIMTPAHEELDITNTESVRVALAKYKPDILLHAAALTSPPRCDSRPLDTMKINIGGTCNVVEATMEIGTRLVYVSTDYVFKGDKGNYAEEDEVYPLNLYAWSKLGGECAVRAYKNSLIIRTSLSPDQFPFEKAFVDQFTSRDTLAVIVPMIYDLTLREDVLGVIHVGTERKSVKELAMRTGKPDVGDLHLNEVSFRAPKDTSFDLTRLHNTLQK